MLEKESKRRKVNYLFYTIFLIIFTNTITVLSQDLSINYSKTVEFKEIDNLCNDKASYRHKMTKRLINKSNNILKSYSYNLKSKGNLCEFKLNGTPKTNFEKVATNLNSSGVFFQDLKNKITLKKRNYNSTNYLIIDPYYKLKWKINKNERKNILGYSCYKATSTRKINRNENEEITAWYSIDLRNPIGLAAYNGLPGIILKLELNTYLLKHKYKCTFLANEINIKKQEIKIKKPTGIRITQEEYNKMVVGEIN